MTGPRGDEKYVDWKRSYIKMLLLILFNFYNKYLTSTSFEGFGGLKIGQVIYTLKYRDDLLLQGMFDKRTEII
jgi:hypothetical protein